MVFPFKSSTTSKLWQFLTPSQRRAAVFLGVMMLIGMLLETLGIGLVIPALALMTQPDAIQSKPLLAPYLSSIGYPSRERLVVLGMVVLLVVYTLKAFFLGYLVWRQSKFVFDLEVVCSQRLFRGYLHQPYTFHLQRNSAHLLRNATTLVSDLTQVVQQGLLLVAEIFVLVGISVLLIAIEPIGAILVVGVLGIAGWGLNKFVRRRILIWGQKRQFNENFRMQHLQQALNGVKDVKLSGREQYFLSQYSLHTLGSAKVTQRRVAFKAIPRLWLELLSVAGLVGLVIVMLERGKPVELLLPTLGLFAAAAFRLMPSVNRILDGLQSIRFTLPVIDTLHSELKLIENTQNPTDVGPFKFEHSIVLDQVSFRYPGASLESLQDVNLTIRKGMSVGFVGGSGAGKSTLVDILIGLLVPDNGAIVVDGVDIRSNLRGWQRLIGYVSQSIYLTDDTLRRNVAFGVPDAQIDELAVTRAIHAAQLESFIADLPEGLDTVVGERGVRLSGGQRQRIGIARALYHDPPVLVLDEATSSLDMATEKGIIDAVGALHGYKTVLIVAHRLTIIQHCDLVVRIEKGLIVDQGCVGEVAGSGLQGQATKVEVG
jgi:ABC-type branched-subunit amino acid transport system ATPase component